MELQLGELLDKLRRTAHEHGVDFVLTGILPTLRHSDLGLENMTPKPRYHALNRAMCAMRDGPTSCTSRDWTSCCCGTTR